MAYWKCKKISYTRTEDLLCLKHKDHILIRSCDISTCHLIPDKIGCNELKLNKMQCPDDLFEVQLPDSGIHCLKISRTFESYNEHFCYGSNKIIPMDLTEPDIAKVLQFLIKKNISDYWLPIRRENSFMPFVVRLPGKSWKKIISENIIISVNDSEKHCLKHTITNEKKYHNVLFTEKCTVPLNMVCVFKYDLPTNLGYPHQFGDLIFSQNESFCIDLWAMDRCIQTEKYLINRNLFNCVLSKSVWNEREKKGFKFNYFNDNFGNKCMIVLNSYNLIHGINKSLHGFPPISKSIIGSTNSKEIKMILKMKEQDKQLTLVIYNRKYLFLNNEHDIGVQCFTYKAYGILRKVKIAIIWENKDQSHSVVLISLAPNYSSEYWCEGHRKFDFQLVTTQKFVVFKNFGLDFVIRWDVTCIHKNKFNSLCEISRMGPTQIVKIVGDLLENIKTISTFDNLKVKQVRVINFKWKPNEFFVYWIHITANLETKEVYTNEIRKADQFINNKSKTNLKTRRFYIKIFKALNSYMNKNWTIRNAEYCFAKRSFLEAGIKTDWIETRIGDIGITKTLCLQNNGMSYTQLCQGDFLRGAYWYKLTQPLFCKPTKNITNILFDIWNSKLLISEPEQSLKKVIELISKNKNALIAADIHIISKIIRINFKSLTVLNSGTLWKNSICAVIKAYNSLTNIKTEALRMSATLNSTNKILESFEESIDTLSILSLSNETFSNVKEDDFEFNNDIIDYQDIGVSVKISKNLLYFLINPIIANVSGIALFSKSLSRSLSQKSLINENYRFLQSNHDTSDFFNEPNLQLGVYLPKDLISSLKSCSDLTKSICKSIPLIIVKVYSNDKLFQHNNTNKIICSRIVSISIPNYSSILPIPIPLIIRKSKGPKLSTSNSCHYWNNGTWANDGITMMNTSGAHKDIVACSLKHLSHFAYISILEGDSEKVFNGDLAETIKIAGYMIMFTGLYCILIAVLKFSL
ncbi:hypothetical protein KR200_000843 [Drosophila serrata]|nr:hypothetical protein KR200_000843 [Drosophila serrata]